MAYAKLFSTITESSLWSASKDARILFMSMLAKADQVGFVEAALPGLARLANLTMAETEGALAVLMAPDPYSKSPDCDGARVVKVERGWCLVNYEAYRDRRDDDSKREYMRTYMRQYRANGNAPTTTCEQPVNSCKPLLDEVGQAEAEAEANTEGEGERDAPATLLVLQDKKGKPLEEYLRDQGCKLSKGEVDLLPEWKKYTKGLKPSQVMQIMDEAKPGILWPSEFKRHREARGV
jgi:hypothetical protein